MNLAKPSFKEYMPSVIKAMEVSLRDFNLKGLKKPVTAIQVTPSLRQAVKSLVSRAKTEQANLIVVGTHARRGFSRFFLGSFTETLLLQSKIPVLVVNPSSKPRPMDRILFPTDFSTPSKAAFRKVVALSRALGGRITLLHVIPHPIEPVFQSGVYLLGGGWVSVPEFMQKTEENQRKIAQTWVQEAARTGVDVDIVFESGLKGVYSAILSQAEALKAGLIAMAAESGPVASTLMGSVTRQVVRDASCPVWIMRR